MIITETAKLHAARVRNLSACREKRTQALTPLSEYFLVSMTTVFVFILSPTEPQQVTNLKRELADCIKKKATLERKVGELKQEKAALKREVAELKQDNEDLNADGETLLEWGNKLRRMGRMIEKDFKNLFQDIEEKKSLFETGTDHTDNCDVSVHVLNYSLYIKIVNLQAIAMGNGHVYTENIR